VWLDDELDDVNLMPVAVGLVVLEVAERMAMRPMVIRVIVFERLLQPMTMMAPVRGRLHGRGHHDMRVIVLVVAVGAVGVFDDFEQAVQVGFRIVVMTVLVLVIVPMRHLSMLGQRPAPARDDQPNHSGGRSDQQRAGSRDRLLERTGLNDRCHQAVEEQLQLLFIGQAAADGNHRNAGVSCVPGNGCGAFSKARRLGVQPAFAGDDQVGALQLSI
jgi:hypothetical protein